MKKVLSRLLIVGLLCSTSLALPACSHPITVESVQRDVAIDGTKLLNAVIPIQDAIKASVDAKLITPAQGITYLDLTKKIGEKGNLVATDLDKLNVILKAGTNPAASDVQKVVDGLTAMSAMFPDLLAGTVPPKVVEAAKQAQALVDSLKTTVANIRSR